MNVLNDFIYKENMLLFVTWKDKNYFQMGNGKYVLKSEKFNASIKTYTLSELWNIYTNKEKS